MQNSVNVSVFGYEDNMARNLGRRVSCDLHSGCPAMILTAGFHGDYGLILFGKIEWSNTTMFIVK